MSELFQFLPMFNAADAEGAIDALRFAVIELLKGGTTTVLDIAVLGESGLRVFTGPMVRSARWYTRNGHEVLEAVFANPRARSLLISYDHLQMAPCDLVVEALLDELDGGPEGFAAGVEVSLVEHRRDLFR